MPRTKAEINNGRELSPDASAALRSARDRVRQAGDGVEEAKITLKEAKEELEMAMACLTTLIDNMADYGKAEPLFRRNNHGDDQTQEEESQDNEYDE